MQRPPLFFRRIGAIRIAAAVVILALSPAGLQGQAPVQKPISDTGWSVAFLGNSYDSFEDASAFFYLVAVAGWEQDLAHWTLAVPGTASAARSQSTGFGLDPVTGLSGHTWAASQPAGSMGFYVLTMLGNPPVGPIEYGVCGASYFFSAATPGPVASTQESNTRTFFQVSWFSAMNCRCFGAD